MSGKHVFLDHFWLSGREEQMAKQPQMLWDGAGLTLKSSWRQEQGCHALPTLGQDAAPWQPQESGSRRGTLTLGLGTFRL